MRRIFVAALVTLVAVVLSACGSSEGASYYSSEDRKALMLHEYDRLAGRMLEVLLNDKGAASYQEAGTVDCVKKKGRPISANYNGKVRLCSADGTRWLSGMQNNGAFSASGIDVVHFPGLDATKAPGDVVGGSFTENGKPQRVNPIGSIKEIQDADQRLLAAFKKALASLG